MVDALEQLDVLLEVLHLQLLLDFVEGGFVCLMPVEVLDLISLLLEVLLGDVHPPKHFLKMACTHLQPVRMCISDFVESLAVARQAVHLVVYKLVASVHFVDENVALLLVGLFQLG